MESIAIKVIYLIASVCFIVGLKMLSSPRRAVLGNKIGAVGMLLAIVATLFHRDIISFDLIIVGLIIGSIAGALLALKIQMTAMPQMVALLNGFGGIASALVACAELVHSDKIPVSISIPIALSILIGMVTFTGSLVAFAKLQELMTGQPVVYKGQQVVNSLLAVGMVVAAVLMVMNPVPGLPFWILVAISTLLGVLLVIPIGGADMPVVIALLNSYSGLAACATGFVLNNSALIISGSLVGASGIILTYLMCEAMNRSLGNVLFGAFGKVDEAAVAAQAAQKSVKVYTAQDAAMIFSNASSVIVVPGYGMAVAQAQHAIKELADLLEGMDTDVKFAIHPVAGRMPGHMNVLLAEADVPYEKLLDIEDVNPLFPQTDVTLVLGANDTVNPAARHDKNSPIYGMPILDADKSATVMVIKRSLRPGFAGIDNELFYNDNTMMVLGDAKKTVMEITQALKNL